MSFRLRLTLLFTTVVFLVFLFFSWTAYAVFSAQIWGELEGKLLNRGEAMAAQIQIQAEDVRAPGSVGHVNAEGRIEFVFSALGRLLLATPGASGQMQPSLSDWDRLKNGEKIFTDLLIGENRWRGLYLPILTGNSLSGVYLIALSAEEISSSLSNLRVILLASTALLVLVAFGLGIFLASWILKPIERMRVLAEEISLRDLRKRLRYRGPRDELGALAETFDLMLDRLEDGAEREKEFFAESSHDLRTPLTVIQGNIELALRNRQASPEELRETMRMILEETKGMSQTLGDLLFLSRSGVRQVELEASPVPLLTLLHDVINALKALAERKGIKIELQGEEINVMGDRDLLYRLFLSLGENGVRYNREGGLLLFAVTPEEKSVLVRVKDTGMGIPAEEIPRIFDRFFRGEEARAREPRGSGLGLSIAKRITEMHGGGLEVESVEGEGASFFVRLPKGSEPFRGTS